VVPEHPAREGMVDISVLAETGIERNLKIEEESNGRS
jgi:hypothetical protein